MVLYDGIINISQWDGIGVYVSIIIVTYVFINTCV